MHSERPKLYTILAFLSAVGLRLYKFSPECNRIMVECSRQVKVNVSFSMFFCHFCFKSQITL